MREASLEEAFKSAFSFELINVFTALPCVVITVHSELSDQRVDVQPLLNKIFPDQRPSQPHPPILSVPVMFPASASSAFTFPLNVGDTVLCVFSQRGLDTFKAGNGLPTAPQDFRKLDKRDAIAIPGLFPFSKAINNPKLRTNPHSNKDAVVAHNIGTSNEVEVRLRPDGSFVVNAPKDVIINSKTTTINSPTTNILGNLNVSGNVTVTGTSTASDHVSGGKSGATHKHTEHDGPSTSIPT